MIFIDGRRLLRRGITVCGDTSPDVVAIVAMVLAALMVIRVIVHAILAHHIVHRLLVLVRQRRKSREVLRDAVCAFRRR